MIAEKLRKRKIIDNFPHGRKDKKEKLKKCSPEKKGQKTKGKSRRHRTRTPPSTPSVKPSCTVTTPTAPATAPAVTPATAPAMSNAPFTPDPSTTTASGGGLRPKLVLVAMPSTPERMRTSFGKARVEACNLVPEIKTFVKDIQRNLRAAMFDMPQSQSKEFICETLSSLDRSQNDILTKLDRVKEYLADSLNYYGRVQKKLTCLKAENMALKESFKPCMSDEWE